MESSTLPTAWVLITIRIRIHNLWIAQLKSQPLHHAATPNCESVSGISVSFTIVTKFQCTIATIVKNFPAPQFFSGKMCHLWLLDSLNVIELTAVNVSSENFQNVDNKQTLWLAIFTKDHQRVVSAHALDQFYYTTNLIGSEYFWTGAHFWSGLD